MNWYYVLNGGRCGPVGAEEFAQLVAAGTIGPETLVWREGMTEWKPYRLIELMGVPVEAAAVAPIFTPAQPGEGQINCSECGRVFPMSQVLDYSGKKICADCKPAFFQKLREAGESAVMSELNYAGFWIRFGAKFIDGLIMYAVSLVCQLTAGLGASPFANRGPEMAVGSMALMMVVGVALPLMIRIAYNGWMVGRFGATLGKMATGVKVVRSDGGGVTYGRAFGRAAAEIVSGMVCLIGYIIAAFDNPQKRALHDHMCDTRVVFKTR